MNRVAKTLSLIVRPVGDACNLYCTYCYLGDKVLQPVKKMSESLLEQLTAEASGIAEQVQFLWHGGEPTLAGISFFEAALEFQARYPNVQFENFIQTNATLIDEHWVRLFLRGNFRVRFSLDGPPPIHDQFRINVAEHGSFSAVSRAISMLLEAGVQLQVSCVITEQSSTYIEGIYAFIRSTGVKWVSFLPAFRRDGEDLHPATLRPASFVRVYKKLFDLWSADVFPLHVRELENIVSNLMGCPSGDCTYTGTCTLVVRVEPGGEVFPCELHTASDSYGRVGYEPLSDILERRLTGSIAHLANRVQNGARMCRWFNICKGGCYAALNDAISDSRYYYCCQARGEVFEHIASAVDLKKVTTFLQPPVDLVVIEPGSGSQR